MIDDHQVRYASPPSATREGGVFCVVDRCQLAVGQVNFGMEYKFGQLTVICQLSSVNHILVTLD